MTQKLIGELYRRYLRGELGRDAAAEQIFAIMQGKHAEPTGLCVDLGALEAADRERTLALFVRVKWHALREALPGADIPPLGPQDFLADLPAFEPGDDLE